MLNQKNTELRRNGCYQRTVDNFIETGRYAKIHVTDREAVSDEANDYDRLYKNVKKPLFAWQ